MKKMALNPLKLDKQTVAMLDANQLAGVKGGRGTLVAAPSSSNNGGSTGCGSGSSQCRAARA